MLLSLIAGMEDDSGSSRERRPWFAVGRERLPPGTFVEIVVWQLPRRLAGSEHRNKYRLALVDQERWVLRYDNETGKGDHRHRGDQEKVYVFTTIERLLADFDEDSRDYINEHPHHR